MQRGAARIPGGLALVLLGAVFLPHWRMVAGLEIPFLGDALREHWPMQAVVSRLLAADPAHLPNWNAWIGCGAPLAANPQYQLFYPPALLYRFLPFALGFGVMLGLHLAIAALGTAAFLKSRGLGNRAAALGALAFSLGGYPHLLLAAPPVLCGWAWLPWVALAAARAGTGRSAAAGLPLGLVLGWVFLAGYPPAVLFAAVLAALVFLGEPAQPGRGRTVVSAAATGAAVAAVGCLPLLGLLAASGGGAATAVAVATQGAMPVWGVLGFLMPLSFLPGGGDDPVLGAPGLWTVIQYAGAVPLALACSAPFLSGRSRLSVPGRLVGLGLLLAFGRRLPVAGPLLASLPPLSWLRHPGAWGALAGFGVAWLAAEGAQTLEERLRTPTGRTVLRGWSGALVFLVGIWVGGNVWHLGIFRAWLDHEAGPLTVALAGRLGGVTQPLVWLVPALVALGLAVRREVPAARVFAFLGVLAWVDLAFQTGPALQPVAHSAWVLGATETDAYFAGAVRPDGWGRVYTTPRLEFAGLVGGEGTMGVVHNLRAAFQSNVPAATGLRQAGGIGPLRPAGTAAALDRATVAPVRPWDRIPARILDRLGVRWLITNSRLDGPGLALRHRAAGISVYAREADLVPAWAEPEGAGRVRYATSPRPGEWRVGAELARPGTVVISESFSPGWVAVGVGAAAPMEVQDGLVGIALPAGRHEFVLRFVPPGGRPGLLVSLAALAGVLGFAVRSRRR